MKFYLLFITLTILFLGACEENADNIEIFLQKQPGSVVGRVYPFNVEAKIGLYQGVVMLISETQTNSDGIFLIKDIQPGIYLLRVSAKGFGTFEIEEVMVSDGESMDVGVIVLSTLPWPLTSTIPEDGTKDVPLDQIVYIYSSKELESESIQSAISINPTVSDLKIEDYYSTYYTPNQHMIRIEAEWVFGTQYDISIDTSLSTILGEYLEFPISLKCTFEQFGLQEIQLPSPNNFSGDIILRFNGELQLSNFISNFIIDPLERGSIQLSTYSNDVYIRAPQYWHPGTTTVTLLAGLSEQGGNTIGTDTTFSFTIDSLSINGTQPFDGSVNVPVYSNIQIFIDYRIDQGTAQNAITFDPAISFYVNEGYDYIDINPYSSFLPDTTYTVTIDTSLHDYWGNPLSKPYSFSFTTE